MLGEPDVVTHRLHFGITSGEVITTYYYLERGYAIWFAYWGFKGMHLLEDSELPALQRNARAFKLVKVGTPLDEALATLGTPDLAEVSRHNEVAVWWVPWTEYQEQRGSADPLDLHGAVWKSRDLFVEFHDGAVEEALPYHEAPVLP
jgi:hypothetical protein